MTENNLNYEVKINVRLIEKNIGTFDKEDLIKESYGLSNEDYNFLKNSSELERQQHNFLLLAVIRQDKYDEIEKELNVNKRILSKWWDELKDKREKWSKIRSIWRSKEIKTDYFTFYRWYSNALKECYYCGITESKVSELWFKYPKLTKRGRGRVLEIDRKIPDNPYGDIDNLTICCYWCNNAKTDTFDSDEFKPIGEEIKKIWEKKLSK